MLQSKIWAAVHDRSPIFDSQRGSFIGCHQEIPEEDC